MKRLMLITLAAMALLAVACDKNNEAKDVADSVVTEDPSDITMNSAVIHGSVNSGFKAAGAEVGFVLSRRAVPSLEKGGQIIPGTLDGHNGIVATLKELPEETHYTYMAFIKRDTTYLFGEVKEFTTLPFAFGAVDMGLSVKWGNANLGAKKPEAPGDHYAWGEIERKPSYTWGTYKWGTGIYNLTKYNARSGCGTVDNKIVLDPEDDVAAVNLGGKWRMPTDAEWNELLTECKWEWMSRSGNNGYKVTSKSTGQSIFLPAAGGRGSTYHYDNGSYGRYWSSTLDVKEPGFAMNLYFVSDYISRAHYDRYYGRSIRPVLAE